MSKRVKYWIFLYLFILKFVYILYVTKTTSFDDAISSQRKVKEKINKWHEWLERNILKLLMTQDK